MAEEDPAGYEAYGEFVKDELDAQEARKTSFEQRGITVITTSGVLATLLFGLGALSTKKAATFDLQGSAACWLSVALVLFAVAAICGLIANIPISYSAVKVEAVRQRIRADPVNSADSAYKDIALTRLDAIETAKDRNKLKGRLLVAALSAEVLAIVAVACAIWIVINH